MEKLLIVLLPNGWNKNIPTSHSLLKRERTDGRIRHAIPFLLTGHSSRLIESLKNGMFIIYFYYN